MVICSLRSLDSPRSTRHPVYAFVAAGSRVNRHDICIATCTCTVSYRNRLRVCHVHVRGERVRRLAAATGEQRRGGNDARCMSRATYKGPRSDRRQLFSDIVDQLRFKTRDLCISCYLKSFTSTNRYGGKDQDQFRKNLHRKPCGELRGSEIRALKKNQDADLRLSERDSG